MKKTIMACLVGASVFTFGTSSLADLQDTNGNTLKTGPAYCIRPIGFEPRTNIAVGQNEYVNLSDHRIDCEYAYILVGDDRARNRVVTAGEVVRFAEVKKESDEHIEEQITF